ncbi:MAG: isocitrate lyase/phosphoenolpyruvate mutase family protein [Burkholderiales bacterium]|nr:isocitrate lyase/phosphoenolpyruvate mutase family protein [Burkholderiales bacterium]
MIIARTDAASGHGLDEAIRRARACRQAGADVVFVELKGSPNVIEELKRVTSEIDAPCLVNVEEAGKVGELTATELDQLGFRIAIYPGLGRYAAGFAIREALKVLKRDGNTGKARDRMLTFKEYNEALKLPEIEEWERKYLLSR